jgi:hypothetical protein
MAIAPKGVSAFSLCHKAENGNQIYDLIVSIP